MSKRLSAFATTTPGLSRSRPDEVVAAHMGKHPGLAGETDRARAVPVRFGKYAGKLLGEVAHTLHGRRYLDWVLGEDFPAELKAAIATLKAAWMVEYGDGPWGEPRRKGAKAEAAVTSQLTLFGGDR